MLHVVEICMLEMSNFTGSVRKSSDQVDVAYLAYEAYESMACKIFVNICSEIRKKWPTIHRICVHHRLGNVAVKEKSVIVAASAPHRAETLDAVKFAIDEIKKTVPIWKKEVYVDKTSKWKAN
ncbi:molybdopterin converting factor, subunit 2 [Trichinella nativa]|uniref:Molybdopterin converting factor, subunit 2 n=1 Tax=Trichinella nativa TaxID=6335 RepID=A0A1Y3ERG3_9BILA|nr:molybdopterin converting factor, subunit 2 [Trichinella spiralis]OUC45678.1 molybdopterin converting factor, subunit 2 [Trichinella nativa]